MICRCCCDSAPTSAPAPPPPPPPPPIDVRRLEVLAERPDAQEVDVARGALRSAGRVVVGRARVVRHGVAGLHAELLEIERVAGRHFGRRLAAAEEADRLLRAAVDRVDQLQVRDREVVVCARFDEELLHRRGVGVAARLRQRDRRRPDRPGCRWCIAATLRPFRRPGRRARRGRSRWRDAVKLPRERAVGIGASAATSRAVVHHDAPARAWPSSAGSCRRTSVPLQRGDVAAVFDRPRREARCSDGK